MKRYRWTLNLLHTLHLLVQEGKLADHIFLHVFEQVMPKWMDLMYSLRSEPGKMELLQEQVVYVGYVSVFVFCFCFLFCLCFFFVVVSFLSGLLSLSHIGIILLLL